MHSIWAVRLTERLEVNLQPHKAQLCASLRALNNNWFEPKQT